MGQHLLLSPAASDFTVEEVDRMSELRAWKIFVEQRRDRQGKDGTQAGPCCDAVAKHRFIKKCHQWRCREVACGTVFSVTSSTKFADHKLPPGTPTPTVFPLDRRLLRSLR
jgi:hypothetical protein